eukprot:1788533-Amphidinium_carterae.1
MLRCSEICQHGPSTWDVASRWRFPQHISRFEITVDETDLVQGGKCACQCPGHSDKHFTT